MHIPLALMIPLLIGCAAANAAAEDLCSIQGFMTLNYDRQVEEIRFCSPSQQVDLYMRAVERTHPPRIGLADGIAPTGAELIPAFLEELKQLKDNPAGVESIVWVFLRMKTYGYYDASTNPKLMEEMSRAIESIRYPDITKVSCREMLEAIRSGQQR